jgi:DNA-binding Lrp family transcriptional regulator
MSDLDDIDRNILAELQCDGRLSIQALAERVGVARATAYARVQRLESAGVITGYRAVVDPAAVGLDLVALVLLTVKQDTFKTLPARLATVTGVEWIGMTTAAYDFALLVRAKDTSHLRDVVLGELQSIPDVLSSQTIMVLDEPAVPSRRF